MPPKSKEKEQPSPETLERLKSTLWQHLATLTDAETASLGTNATSQFIAALTEAVWKHIEDVGRDLEGFAKHAGRGTVTTKDVLLLGRRNDALKEVMEEWVRKRSEE